MGLFKKNDGSPTLFGKISGGLLKTGAAIGKAGASVVNVALPGVKQAYDSTIGAAYEGLGNKLSTGSRLGRAGASDLIEGVQYFAENAGQAVQAPGGFKEKLGAFASGIWSDASAPFQRDIKKYVAYFVAGVAGFVLVLALVFNRKK